MGEHVADAAPADRERLGRHRAAAAHLGADGDQPGPASGGSRRARFAEIADHHRERRVEGARRRDALAMELDVVGRLEDGARADGERRAAGVQVEEGVAARKHLVADERGDLLRHAAARIAGKRAVEVAAVDRRGALAGDDRVHVVRRHEDEPPLDRAGIEVADQLADDDRPFILVAVIAALEDDGRPFPVLDDRDRNPRAPQASSCGECGI